MDQDINDPFGQPCNLKYMRALFDPEYAKWFQPQFLPPLEETHVSDGNLFCHLICHRSSAAREGERKRKKHNNNVCAQKRRSCMRPQSANLINHTVTGRGRGRSSWVCCGSGTLLSCNRSGDVTVTAEVVADPRLDLFDCGSRRAAGVLTDAPRLDGFFDLAQIREVAGDPRTYEDNAGL